MSIWDDVRVGDQVRAVRNDSSLAFPVVEIRRLHVERLNPSRSFSEPEVHDDVEVIGSLPSMSAIQSDGWNLSITVPNPYIPMGDR